MANVADAKATPDHTKSTHVLPAPQDALERRCQALCLHRLLPAHTGAQGRSNGL